jgi:transcriptional regulator with PAS, ATPase and Fis domain
LDPDLLEALSRYGWPGNIRELQNVLERAVILGRGCITVQELPEQLRSTQCFAAPETIDGSLRDMERSAILETLAGCGNNRRLAAERLGISKRTLQYRLKEYGLLVG